MIKSISMLDLRKKPGEVLDETFYKKYRFLVKRNKKPMAVIIPIEDFKRYFEDEDAQVYADSDVKNFLLEDKLTSSGEKKVKNLLSK